LLGESPAGCPHRLSVHTRTAGAGKTRIRVLAVLFDSRNSWGVEDPAAVNFTEVEDVVGRQSSLQGRLLSLVVAGVIELLRISVVYG
jgi:hypothetical protein